MRRRLRSIWPSKRWEPSAPRLPPSATTATSAATATVAGGSTGSGLDAHRLWRRHVRGRAVAVLGDLTRRASRTSRRSPACARGSHRRGGCTSRRPTRSAPPAARRRRWRRPRTPPPCPRGQRARVSADGAGDVQQRLHLGVEAIGRADLDRVEQRRPARARPRAPSRAVACAAWESMQKKQSLPADTAVASISRSCARDRRPGIRLDEQPGRPVRAGGRRAAASGASRRRCPGTSGRLPTIGSSCARSCRSSSRAIATPATFIRRSGVTPAV